MRTYPESNGTLCAVGRFADGRTHRATDSRVTAPRLTGTAAHPCRACRRGQPIEYDDTTAVRGQQQTLARLKAQSVRRFYIYRHRRAPAMCWRSSCASHFQRRHCVPVGNFRLRLAFQTLWSGHGVAEFNGYLRYLCNARILLAQRAQRLELGCIEPASNAVRVKLVRVWRAWEADDLIAGSKFFQAEHTLLNNACLVCLLDA